MAPQIGGAIVGYVNPQVGALFATARPSGDPAVRKQALQDLRKLLIDDIPVVWPKKMAWPTNHDKKVHNLVKLGTGFHASFDDVFLA